MINLEIPLAKRLEEKFDLMEDDTKNMCTRETQYSKNLIYLYKAKELLGCSIIESAQGLFEENNNGMTLLDKMRRLEIKVNQLFSNQKEFDEKLNALSRELP